MVKFILLLISIVALPIELVYMILKALILAPQITFKKWWEWVITIMKSNEHDESRNA